MSSAPSPLAAPLAWDLVSGDYAKELVPQFELFARDALALGAPRRGGRILDVACGPGTLSMLAAPAAEHVDALDFSPKMLDAMRARLAADGVRNVTVTEGDGQALPYPDGKFDAAFSMFGLIFYPDRALGFREMKRVLVPGGRAVVGSWQPFDRVPLLKRVFTMLAEKLPNLPFGQNKAPLGDRDEFATEMREAGFGDVRVEPSVHGVDTPSMSELWASVVRTNAALVLLQRKMGEAWPALSDAMLAGLTEEFGGGPQHLDFYAWLGVGVA